MDIYNSRGNTNLLSVFVSLTDSAPPNLFAAPTNGGTPSDPRSGSFAKSQGTTKPVPQQKGQKASQRNREKGDSGIGHRGGGTHAG